MISEGKAVLAIKQAKIVSKALPVFYNPIMKLQRDLCVLLVKALGRKFSVADILAGSGIRSIRLWLEARSSVKELHINEGSRTAFNSIKKHLTLNKIKSDKTVVSCKEASRFLLESSGFDFIDIDPFGSPNAFIDAAVKRLSRNGILALTATDTAALAGSSPKACVRKYWSLPLRNHFMHETGLRILTRKAQLAGAQYEKALTPVFCHSTAHYSRVYLRCEKGRKKVDNIFKHHGFVLFCPKCFETFTSRQNFGSCCGKPMKVAGPLWLGQLWDCNLVNKMLKMSSGEAKNLLGIISKECRIPQVGFYDWYRVCSLLGRSVPKRESIFSLFRKKGFAVSPTHFSSQGLRTTAPLSLLKRFLGKHLP
jgi:tRNA (guanine26-N2/guanine27-N2)-dimethyltransferase